jgi:uncharacterized lipoprotein YmbA
MMSLRPLCSVLLTMALVGCSSAPTHFYTLLPARDAAPASSGAAALQFELLPVDVPAQVDRSEMVVRTGGGEMTPVDTRLWAAPLASELHTALSSALTRKLNARDVYGLPHDDTLPTWRIKLSLQRFDSALGAYARIDASWSLQRAGDKAATVCSSSVSETIAPGYDALAAGHQQAIDAIAAQIAQSLSAAGTAHGAARCPS